MNETLASKTAGRRIALMNELRALETMDEPTAHDSYREPLCVDTFIMKKIFLSFGGPADGFILYFQAGELSHGVYFYSDWGTYNESALCTDEATMVAEFYGVTA